MNLSRRNCHPQCGSEMFAPAILHNRTAALYIGRGFKVQRIGPMRACVCPECGKIGRYFDDTDKLKS